MQKWAYQMFIFLRHLICKFWQKLNSLVMWIIAQNSDNKVSVFFHQFKFARYVNLYPKYSQSNDFFFFGKLNLSIFTKIKLSTYVNYSPNFSQ